VGETSKLEKLIVSENGSGGISTARNALIRHVTATRNAGGDGILGNNMVVHASTASRNTLYGIDVGDGSLVSANSSSLNVQGIRTGEGAAVQRNDVSLNTAVGLNLGAQTAYTENRVYMTGGLTVNGGISLFPNSCNGVATCP